MGILAYDGMGNSGLQPVGSHALVRDSLVDPGSDITLLANPEGSHRLRYSSVRPMLILLLEREDLLYFDTNCNIIC